MEQPEDIQMVEANQEAAGIHYARVDQHFKKGIQKEKDIAGFVEASPTTNNTTPKLVITVINLDT